jgi:uncharacterized protein YjiS (DUF1127 family)
MTMTLMLTDRIPSPIVRLDDWIDDRRRLSDFRRELMELDDHRLDDIGINSGERAALLGYSA